MADRVYADIEPSLLGWARQSARLQLADAARKAQVRPGNLSDWEEGRGKPSLPQLRKLARAYKRPLAVFYLPTPPADFQAMHDFRRLHDAEPGVVSPELSFQMRIAHARRQLALDLYEAVEGPVPELGLVGSLNEDAEALGARIREFLGVSVATQRQWAAGYESFNGWREALEAKGVLVFQARDVDVQEARGFSISETPLPVVVVNIKDALTGRIFTMMHELSHVALRAGGLCDLSNLNGRPPEDQRTEVFCNAAAAAALLPAEDLLLEEMVRSNPRPAWSDQQLNTLSNGYGVSREAMLRRLLTLGKTTEGFYEEYRERYAQAPNAQQGGGFAPPDRLAVSTSGLLFTRLVLGNYHQNTITASDVAEYLSVRLKHLPKIEAHVLGKNRRAETQV